MPSARWNYVDVTCSKCSKAGRIRIDQFNRKGKEWECRSCARTGIKVKVKNPSAKHDPIKQGAYKSYWRAKKRVADNHKGAYGHVRFNFTSFEQFYSELGPRPEGCTLDRIDVNGHYEPGNVRWATIQEQARNRRSNIFITYNGEIMCLSDAARISGKDPEALKRRLETGCPEEFLFADGKWFADSKKFFPL